MQPRLPLSVSLLCLLLASPALASSVNFTESTDVSTITLSDLGIGINTITGSVNGNVVNLTGDYLDLYHLNLPTGLAISSGSVQISNFNGGSGGVVAELTIQGNGPETLDTSALSGHFDLNIAPPFNQTASFDPGTGTTTNSFSSGQFNYVVTYNVVAVSGPSPNPAPLPPAALMAIAPVALLALRRFLPKR